MISKKKSISKNIRKSSKLINSLMDITNFRKYKIQFACGKCKQKSNIKYKLDKLNSSYAKKICCPKCNSKLINHKIKIKQCGGSIINKIPIVASGFIGLISLFIYLKNQMKFSLNDIFKLFNDTDNNNVTYTSPTLVKSKLNNEYEPSINSTEDKSKFIKFSRLQEFVRKNPECTRAILDNYGNTSLNISNIKNIKFRSQLG